MYVTRDSQGEVHYSDSGIGALICEWFAMCDNTATVIVTHPVLGRVPTCEACADKLGLVVA